MNIADTLANKAYKKIIIYYFSGTGNSKNVANWIAPASENYKIECQLVNIANIDSKDLTVPEADTLIIFQKPRNRPFQMKITPIQ